MFKLIKRWQYYKIKKSLHERENNDVLFTQLTQENLLDYSRITTIITRTSTIRIRTPIYRIFLCNFDIFLFDS